MKDIVIPMNKPNIQSTVKSEYFLSSRCEHKPRLRWISLIVLLFTKVNIILTVQRIVWGELVQKIPTLPEDKHSLVFLDELEFDFRPLFYSFLKFIYHSTFDVFHLHGLFSFYHQFFSKSFSDSILFRIDSCSCLKSFLFKKCNQPLNQPPQIITSLFWHVLTHNKAPPRTI